MPQNKQPALFQSDDDSKELSKAAEVAITNVGSEIQAMTHSLEVDNKGSLKVKVGQFNSILNRKPLQRMVRTHQGYLYLPVRYYERLLQQIFLGQTKLEVISFSQIFNEVCVHVRVHYKHPITLEWLFVDGLGSSQIMQDKDTKVMDFAAHKKPNALQTCLPKAKSEAFKNACKGLGSIFGSDLNRKTEEGDYDAATNTVRPLNA